MEDSDAVRDLMAKLMEAVEASLSSSKAVREALAELVSNGYEARLFFVASADSGNEDGDGESTRVEDDEDETPAPLEIGAVLDEGELAFELTKLDQDFLKSLKIRPESG